jgi:hypothetical protein
MRRGRIALDDLDFGLVHMRENLVEIAHVKPFPAARAFHE